MAKTIEVLVVDDSAFMRKMLTDILASTDDIRVSGTARNGLEALDKVREIKPDVITLDIHMPSMDGLSCLKEIQKITDIPVIMLSSLTVEGGRATIEALESGAIDFITKPAGLFEISGEEKKAEIIEKIRMAYEVLKRNRGSKQPVKPGIVARPSKEKYGELKALIVIGTSTGGPKALQEVIPYIPEDISAAILIVQHMPPGFTKSLADRLNTLSGVNVKEGEEGEIVRPGYAYIAPGDFHMEVDTGKDGTMKIRITKDKPVGGHRPAVNVLMNSIARTGFPNVIGVIMTGMGSDGKEGIVSIKEANKAVVICQDEISCVVYGMPKSAISTGLVDAIVPLKEIAGVIVKYMGVEQ
ncbi:MAG: chemotaxis response regulator protein-glutamate methylesterase [Clostridiaceae bacterium]|nr:chemotaxis response regulator protein-glutamate methylesterase [Clostridiaceae bacterium]